MERSEIIDFLRESLRIEISTNTNYECDREYVTISVRLLLDDEEITSSYDSVSIR